MITPGTLLQNRYLVHEQVGQGGMGTVYRATDERFGSIVALKETCFADPNLRRAFEREAALLNRLRHTALPRVSDHFDEGNSQFLVMEFVEGCDLAERLEAQEMAFPVANVLAWADELLDALEYLHAQDPPVIHRDIKPQNLKLTRRGTIVLLDFGLAKNTPTHLSRVTVTGSVFGYSRNYAPLEQMHGTGTDPRSDLYALGATIYHLVTGIIPPDAITRATAVLNSQPDPLYMADEVHAQVSPALADWLSVAMRQSANGRFPSAGEMRRALAEVASGTYVIASRNLTQHMAQRDFSPSFFEQDTKLFGSPTQTARIMEVAETPGKASGETTMLSRGDDIAPPMKATRANNPYATHSMETASTTARHAGGKRRLAYAAATVAALVITASAFVAFIGGTVEPATHLAKAPVSSANAMVERQARSIVANNVNAQGATTRTNANTVGTAQRKSATRAKTNLSPQRRRAGEANRNTADADPLAAKVVDDVIVDFKGLKGVELPPGITLDADKLQAFVLKRRQAGEEVERRSLKRERDNGFRQFENYWRLNQERAGHQVFVPAPPVPAEPTQSFSPQRHTPIERQRRKANGAQNNGGANGSSSPAAPPAAAPLSLVNSAGARAVAACGDVLC